MTDQNIISAQIASHSLAELLDAKTRAEATHVPVPPAVNEAIDALAKIAGALISVALSTSRDRVVEAARDLLLASDESDGEFSGSRLDRLRETRETLAAALRALEPVVAARGG